MVFYAAERRDSFGRPGAGAASEPRPARDGQAAGHILIVDDQDLFREALGQILHLEGYETSFAENGREALNRLRTESLPDLIVLDLKMPVMDGWEFRTIQRDDPKLGLIPVVALSADRSMEAAAISAQRFLRKPIDRVDLLATIEDVLFDAKRREAAQKHDADRVATLGQLAAHVGHEINNPLSIVLLNLRESLETLFSLRHDGGCPDEPLAPEFELDQLKASLGDVVAMLKDCETGSERIRATVGNLQRLSQLGSARRESVNVQMALDEALGAVWEQIYPRARVIKTYNAVIPICGDAERLRVLFVNLLLNAAEAIPLRDGQRDEIRISTWLESRDKAEEVVIEIADSGRGIAPENMSRLFEPFFTTKCVGEGPGLGLSISQQTVQDHGGRMTFQSARSVGTTVRVFFPASNLQSVPQ